MKNFFGLFSLIAILTVSFATTATATTTKAVNHDIGFYVPTAVDSLTIAPVASELTVFVIDTASYSSRESLVTELSVSTFVTIDSATTDVPIDYGLSSTSSYTIDSKDVNSKENTSRTIRTSSQENTDYNVGSRYVDAESPVGWANTEAK